MTKEELIAEEREAMRRDMLQEAYNERHKTYPEWDDLRYEVDRGELLEIIDALILEPRAFDDLNKYIRDTYDCYEDE